MKVSIIAAMDEKRGIGKNNDLLFRIPEDFARMSQITVGNPIVIGRKTFLSIGRILPGRYNIVITRNPEFKINNAREGKDFAVVRSLEEGLSRAKEILKQVQNDNNEEVFIFGGGEIFKEALARNLVDKLYLTIVEGDFDADTFFPDYSEFKKVVFEKKGEGGGYKYKFLELEK